MYMLRYSIYKSDKTNKIAKNMVNDRKTSLGRNVD